MRQFLFVPILVIAMFSCEDNDESFCFSFDERQCATDIWKDDMNLSLTEAQKITALTDALQDLGIEVKEVNIDPNFHDAVCEACHVCPTGMRFYVKVSSDPGQKIESLELLDYKVEACNSVF